MSSYSVELKPHGRNSKRYRIACSPVVKKIESLGDAPRPTGCKKLKGYKDQWRVRVGGWRVVYIIDDPAKRISVTRIAHRRDVYER